MDRVFAARIWVRMAGTCQRELWSAMEDLAMERMTGEEFLARFRRLRSQAADDLIVADAATEKMGGGCVTGVIEEDEYGAA